LYASFIPVIVAALWGSSNQLHTGPVAMLSLMSAAALITFATPGSPEFIELSIMLAVMVGVLRLALGIFRLGAIVNLLSSPVIVGFTNAAALIIGFSQLSKIMGVPFPHSDFYLFDLSNVILQVPQLHVPTLLFAIGAWLMIDQLKKIVPAVPGVLAAVVISTIISAAIGYEDKIEVSPAQIKDEYALQTINVYQDAQQSIQDLTASIADKLHRAQSLEAHDDIKVLEAVQTLRAAANIESFKVDKLKTENNARRIELHRIVLHGVGSDPNHLDFYTDTSLTGQETDGKVWRFHHAEADTITLSAGGAVVGDIPQGLPSFSVPTIHWDLLLALLPAALVMALIGFMEATSISKVIATKTGEQVDTNKELIGQGLANIAGSFFGSFTVSGSFSRSAVAAKTGAKTGLFAIISALSVVLVLLFFTSYLYHLPQAVLAVIVMSAVFSLIRIEPLKHAWKIDRYGALIGIITFIGTLLMAPAIADGILLGVLLTLLHFLIRTMKPRVAIVSRKPDGTLGGMVAHNLEPISQHVVPIRFDGSLTFINVAYFEDSMLEAHAAFPQAKIFLIIGSGINSLDASGEEKVREVVKRLDKVGVKLVFSGLKKQVIEIMDKSGLTQELGADAFYSDKEAALNTLIAQQNKQMA
jgi:MFS superfamily sulfate permease-like transporter